MESAAFGGFNNPPFIEVGCAGRPTRWPGMFGGFNNPPFIEVAVTGIDAARGPRVRGVQ